MKIIAPGNLISPTHLIKFVIAGIALFFQLFIVNAQKTVFVNGSILASGSGGTWASAFKTITSALATGGTGQLNIYIKGGTYNGNYSIPIGRNIYIKAGYPGSLSGIDTSGYDPVANRVNIAPSSTSSPAFEFSGSYSNNLSIIGVTFTTGSSTFHP